jgi:hypothetical protein
MVGELAAESAAILLKGEKNEASYSRRREIIRFTAKELWALRASESSMGR